MGLDDLFNPRPTGTDAPREGTYQWLRRGRPAQPVRILFGRPVDPDTGAVLDRSPRWQMFVSGRLVVMEEDWKTDPWEPIWSEVWPQCSGDPIPYPEYRFLLERVNYAQQHDHADPFAQPNRKIDLRTATMPL